jgi:hypothetical protein
MTGWPLGDVGNRREGRVCAACWRGLATIGIGLAGFAIRAAVRRTFFKKHLGLAWGMADATRPRAHIGGCRPRAKHARGRGGDRREAASRLRLPAGTGRRATAQMPRGGRLRHPVIRIAEWCNFGAMPAPNQALFFVSLM